MGQKVKCLNNLKQCANAINMYVDDQDGRLPGGVVNAWGDPSWHCRIAVYFDSSIEFPASASSIEAKKEWIFKCPSSNPVLATQLWNYYVRDYAINAYMQGKLISRIKGNVGMLFDAKYRFVTINPGNYYWLNYLSFRHSGRTNCIYADGHAESSKLEDFTDASFYPIN
jgi:prepilin-type processing-associated H-X9-DG protein